MPAIRCQEISKRYLIGKRKRRHELWALRDISLDIAPGTLVGVVGPNGAGKTTLLKVLSRVTPPTSGVAMIRGRVVSLLEVGAAFQPELTARENIMLNAALFGIPRSEVLRRLDPIAEFAELEGRFDQPVKRFSSGMYLRLAFSVAINMDPDVLLADEVLAVGDAVFQERCLERIEQAGRDGLTVVFVSHDLSAVRRLCGRALWLDEGRLVDDGTTALVTGRYETAARVHAMSLDEADGGSGPERGAFGRLVDVTLTDQDGSPLGAVRTNEAVDVRIRFQTTVDGVHVRPGILLRTGGAAVFRSMPEREVRVPELGTYEARVAIPPHLLADHVYSIKVGVTMRRAGAVTSVARENAVSFRAYHVDEPADALWAGPAVGMLQPQLRWTAPTPVAGRAPSPD